MPDQAEQQQHDAQDHNQPDAHDSNSDTDSSEKKSRRKFLIIVIVVILAVAAGFFYWRSSFSEDTDDAQVDGNLYQVSSRVTGQVIKVYVDDNQKVEAGQLLVEVDTRDYQVALEQAEASLASAQASYVQATVNVPITSVSTRTSLSSSNSDVRGAAASVAQAQKQAEASQARIAQARANAEKARLDVERYTPLVQKDVISKQQFDGAVATAAASTATVLEAEAQALSSQEGIRLAQQRLAQSTVQAQQALQNGPSQVKAELVPGMFANRLLPEGAMTMTYVAFGWYPYLCLTVFLLGSLLRYDREQVDNRQNCRNKRQ